MELGSRPFMDKEVIKEGITQVKYTVCGGMCMYVYCPAVTEQKIWISNCLAAVSLMKNYF